jgi:hypothetical protein
MTHWCCSDFCFCVFFKAIVLRFSTIEDVKLISFVVVVVVGSSSGYYGCWGFWLTTTLGVFSLGYLIVRFVFLIIFKSKSTPIPFLIKIQRKSELIV